MGVKKEELLNEVTQGGVATYLERTEKTNLNLFLIMFIPDKTSHNHCDKSSIGSYHHQW